MTPDLSSRNSATGNTLSAFIARRCLTLAAMLLWPAPSLGQFTGPDLGACPWVFNTFGQEHIKVSVMARGMDHPFGMEFIPATATALYPLGDILISERYGKVRLFRNGHLQEQPVADLIQEFPL